MGKVIHLSVTSHEASEWARMADAAYKAGHNAVGHRFSVASALYWGKTIPAVKFDELQRDYRAWLVDNIYE